MRTLSELDEFPDEAAIVGRLILAYGELEWTLSLCLAAVLDDATWNERLNRAGRTLYRARGEEHRINVADALMRDRFKLAGLDPPYSEFIGDLRYCKRIRNQYAHCHWRVDENSLTLFSFEEGAKSNDDFTMQPYSLTLPVLKAQEAFFSFVWTGMMLLYRHYAHFAGHDKGELFAFPKKLDRPPMNGGVLVRTPDA